MAKRNTIKASELNGLSIYHEPKKGTIFYDIFTRRAFILTNGDVQNYFLYSAVLPMSILLSFTAMSLFSLSYVDVIIIFLIAYILGAVLFRIFFFYKLPEIKNWTPPKREGLANYMAKNFSRKRLLVLICLLLALAVLMILYAYQQGYTGLNLYASYLLSAVTSILAGYSILAIFKQKEIK